MRHLVPVLTAGLMAVGFGTSFADKTSRSGNTAALDGYCPVAYVAMHKAVKGDPEVSLDYEGKHYLFVNVDAKKMFEAAPSKYQVAYDGWCATAMSTGKKLGSNSEIFTVTDGVTYLFSGADAKKMFDASPAAVIKKAGAQWASLR